MHIKIFYKMCRDTKDFKNLDPVISLKGILFIAIRHGTLCDSILQMV